MWCVCGVYDVWLVIGARRVCNVLGMARRDRRRRCVIGMFRWSPRGDFFFMWGCFIIYRINGYVLNVWLWRI